MKDVLEKLRKDAQEQISKLKDTNSLENLRIRYLGKKGELSLLLKELPKLSPNQRAVVGKLANEVKKEIEELFSQKQKELGAQTKEEWIDITAPGVKPPLGHLHLVTQAIWEITDIFERIGFQRVRYPEVDWDWYVFEGLNMPRDHPARDEWETFFVDAPENKKYGNIVLTTHTSNGQLREMEKGQLPIRMINIAKCYRRQSDVSHSPMFHQFEGLVVDKNINITHLKGTLDYFVKQFFGENRKARIRPHHFQFTEPSFEVDVSCGNCDGQARLPDGQGCRLCKEGWLELGGSGMVHPQVLRNGGIDPEKYSGFAFGWGVERVLMMKQGLKLDDIRILYQNDLRFLKQF